MGKGMTFMKKHPAYVGTIHAIGGLGVGFLIANYVQGLNLLLWGIILILLSIFGHVYAWFV